MAYRAFDLLEDLERLSKSVRGDTFQAVDAELGSEPVVERPFRDFYEPETSHHGLSLAHQRRVLRTGERMGAYQPTLGAQPEPDWSALDGAA